MRALYRMKFNSDLQALHKRYGKNCHDLYGRSSSADNRQGLSSESHRTKCRSRHSRQRLQYMQSKKMVVSPKLERSWLFSRILSWMLQLSSLSRIQRSTRDCIKWFNKLSHLKHSRAKIIATFDESHANYLLRIVIIIVKKSGFNIHRQHDALVSFLGNRAALIIIIITTFVIIISLSSLSSLSSFSSSFSFFFNSINFYI